MKIINILLVLLALSGCASQPPTSDQKTEIPEVAASLVQRCPDLPEPAEVMNLGDLMVYTKNVMVLYIECANRHDALVKAAGGKIKLSK